MCCARYPGGIYPVVSGLSSYGITHHSVSDCRFGCPGLGGLNASERRQSDPGENDLVNHSVLDIPGYYEHYE